MTGGLGIDLASTESLRTFIPATFSLACNSILLLFFLLNLWKPTRTLFEFLGRPFRPFLTLDDVAEYEPSLKKLEVNAVEIKCLRVLCFVQTVGWSFWTALSIANGTEHILLVGLILVTLSWVSILLPILLVIT